jgi:hypothetical protein
MHDLVQATLTAATEIIAIAGITGIAAHAIWKQHTSWMKMYCPPVGAYTPDTRVEEEVATAVPQPEPKMAIADDDDIWKTPILTSAPRYWERPSQEIKPALMLLPAASEIKAVTPSRKAAPKKSQQPLEINLNSLDPTTLRKLCSQHGINWRDARGKGKHLTKAAMVFRLNQKAVA